MTSELFLPTPGSVYKHGGAEDISTATPASNAIPKANSSAKLDPGWFALQMSLTSDASGVKLVNDSTSPGANKVYGTDGSGVRGWKADPSGGGGVTDGDKGEITIAGGVWTVDKQMSITSDASGLKLSGDSASPGNNYVYGTDGSGVKGWKADTSIATVTPTASKIPLANASAKLDPGWLALQMSITSDASGVKLSGDTTTPGANQVYGTDGSGVKGWKADTSIATATPTANKIPLANASAKLDPLWIAYQMSITSDGAGIKLSGDATTPGASQVYGTDGAGVKGWKADTSIGTVTPTASKIPLANASAKLDPGWLALQMTITSDASGVKLVNDSTSPGANKVYGTDSSGVKGWKADPSGGGGVTFSNSSRVLGRKTAGGGASEELTFSEVLDFVGSAAQGDILYRGSSGWARLPAGTAGYALQTQGPGANPVWGAAGGGSLATDGSNLTSPATWLSKLGVIDQFDDMARIVDLKGGLMFDGITSGQRMSAYLGDINIGRNDFTIQTILRLPSSNPSISASIFAISTATNTTAAYSLYSYIATDGKLYVVLYGLSTSSANTWRWISNVSFVGLAPGKLCFLTVTRSSGTGAIYLNGVDITSQGTWSTGGGGSYAPDNFGESIGGGWLHIGGATAISSYPEQIVSVALFNYAMSAAEVLQLGNYGIAAQHKWVNYPGYASIHSAERNAMFAKSGTEWVATGGGSSISSVGAVVLAAAGHNISLSGVSGYIGQLNPNVQYNVAFNVSSGTYGGNTVTAYWGTSVGGTNQNIGTFGADGYISFLFTPAFGRGVLSLVASGACNFTITNVKITRAFLPNGNFETAGTGGGSGVANNIAMYWLSVYSGTSVLSLDNTVYFSSGNSIKFNRTTGADDVAHYLASTSPNLLIPGRKYRLVFYAKGNAGGELIAVIDAATASAYQSGISLTTSWVRYTVDFTAKGVRFGIRQNFTGTGIWWIDELEIIELGAVAEFDPNGLDETTGMWANNNPNGGDGILYGCYQRPNGTYNNVIGGVANRLKRMAIAQPFVDTPGLSFPGNANQRVTCSNMWSMGTNDVWFQMQFLCPASNPSGSVGLYRFTSSSTNAAAAGTADLYISNAGHLFFTVYGATTSDYRNLQLYDFVTQYAGQRVDVIVNRTSSGARIWVNGVPKFGVENTAGTIPAWQYSLSTTYCHFAATGTQYWIGDIYTFKIGRGSLTDMHAWTLSRNGMASASGTPISYWVLGATAGIIAQPNLTLGYGYTYPDMAGNGYVFTSNLLDERHKTPNRINALHYELPDRRSTLCAPNGGTGVSAFGDTYSVQGTGSSSAADANQPQCTNVASAATSGSFAGHYGSAIHYVSRNPRALFDLRLVDLTNARVWVGFHSTAVANANTDTMAAYSAAIFRFSTVAGDTTWKCITANASTQTIGESSFTVNTTRILLEIEIISGSKVNFYINGALVCTNTLTLPSSSALLRPHYVICTQENVAKNIKIINISTNS